MALDDKVNEEFLKHGSVTGNFKGIIERVKAGEGPSDSGHYDPKYLETLISYADDGPVTDDEITALREGLTPEICDSLFANNISKAYKNARGKLVGLVEPNYGDILGKFDGATLLNLMASTAESASIDDSYKGLRDAKSRAEDWQKKAVTGDIDYYISQTQNGVVKEALGKIKSRADGSGIEILRKGLFKRAERYQLEFFSEIVKDKKDLGKLVQGINSNGKNPELISEAVNADKLRGYLKSNIVGLSDGDKVNAYEIAGLNYAQYVQEANMDKLNASHKSAYKE